MAMTVLQAFLPISFAFQVHFWGRTSWTWRRNALFSFFKSRTFAVLCRHLGSFLKRELVSSRRLRTLQLWRRRGKWMYLGSLKPVYRLLPLCTFPFNSFLLNSQLSMPDFPLSLLLIWRWYFLGSPLIYIVFFTQVWIFSPLARIPTFRIWEPLLIANLLF